MRRRQRYKDARPECLSQQLNAILSLLTSSYRSSTGRRIRMAMYYVKDGRKYLVCVRTAWYPDYTLPGGRFEGRETPEEAGSRELFEETRRCIRGSSYTRLKPGYQDRPETRVIDVAQPQLVVTYNNYEKGFSERITFLRITEELYEHLVPCLLDDYRRFPKYDRHDPYTEIIEAKSFEIGDQLIEMMIIGILQINGTPLRLDETITFGLLDGLLGSKEVVQLIETLVTEYQKTNNVEQLRDHLRIRLVAPMVNRLNQQLPN